MSLVTERRRPAPRPLPRPRRPVAPASRASRVGRLLLAVIAAAIFFGPNLARLAGVEPAAIENRALRPFPSITAGWDFLPRLDGWAVDHLPLRDRAVAADRLLAEELYGELPTVGKDHSLVIQGPDGWLFYGQDVALRCEPKQVPDEIWAAVGRLEALVRSRGGRMLLFIPPDKTSFEADRMPSAYPRKGCGESADRAFWQRVQQNPPAGYVDLIQPLRRVRAEHGQAYLRSDTHWTPYAATEFTRAVVAAADPAVGGTATFAETGSEAKRTDLSVFAGAPRYERRPVLSSPRPELSTRWSADPHGELRTGVWHSRTTGTGAPLVQAKTLLLGDSFAETALHLLSPYFQELTYRHWRLAADAATVPALAAEIATAPVVVLQVVQREFVSGRNPLLQQATLDLLERELARR